MSFDAFQSAQATPETTPNTESTTPETPQNPTPPETPAPQALPPAAKDQQSLLNQDPNTETPEYTPNFKFKVMDKEHEFPELFRGVVKDAETEKTVREFMEKAYGLDVVKPRLKEYQEKYKETHSLNQQIMQGIEELRGFYSKEDFDSFFKRLNIPEEKVLQWVINKAQYNQLPPEQRKVLDDKRAAEERAFALEKQQGQLQQQLEEQQTYAKAVSLQVALEKSDIKPLAEAFDARVGKPGAFREAIIDAGELAWLRSNGKVDLTPEQAIQQVLATWGNPLQTPAQQMIPAQTGSPQPAAAPVAQKPAAIPNVASRQSSSVSKAKPKSIEDLKKLAAQMAG